MPMQRVRFVSAAQRAAAQVAAGAPELAAGTDPAAGWRPLTWLGAPAPGGLALPAARPSASWMYAPRGVHLGQHHGGTALVVADTGNHRVMIWHELPDKDEQPCDVVLGQPDAHSEGPAAGRGDTRRGMHLPTGVLVHDGKLVVADAWHHRILIYDGLPQSPEATPGIILGQDGPDEVQPNRGAAVPARDSLYWPFGVAVVAGRFYVADTGNRRVLGWSGGLPAGPGEEPDIILGQPDAASREENRGGAPGPASFRWPHAITGTSGTLLIADAGNHRILGWSPHPDKDTGAGLVLGQPDFSTAAELPYVPQGGDMLRFPYATDASDDWLVAADTANNRVLAWDRVPGTSEPATAVLGQPGFGPNGENRWSGVTKDSLCWPYGLSLRESLLAIADSGNNRVVIWGRTA